MSELKLSYGNFADYNAAVAEELTKASESFVRIGYLLKLARDTDVLHGSGYEDVMAYAEGEYHLDKTQVSRFIRINDRFSEGGNSEQLREEFRGLGYAKLSLMLLIPDALNEELTPAFSKAEITVLKEEVQEEQRVTPIERMLEGEKPELETMNLLEKVIWELLRVNQHLYEALWKLLERQAGEDEEKLGKEVQSLLAPGGEQIYSVRIQGTGRIALSLKGTDRDVVLINMRTEEKEAWGWHYLVEAIRGLVRSAGSAGSAGSAAEEYERMFCEAWERTQPDAEEETKPAPVRAEERKEGKVKKADSRKKKAPDRKKAEEKPQKAETVPSSEIMPPPEILSPSEIPQCEGQTDFRNFPEILPQEIVPTEESRDSAVKWEEALPCPFCGSSSIHVEKHHSGNALGWMVLCESCAAGIGVGVDLSEEEVKDRWNRRAAEQM